MLANFFEFEIFTLLLFTIVSPFTMSCDSVSWTGLREEVLQRLFVTDRSSKGSWAKQEFLNLRKLSKHFQSQIDAQVKVFKPASLKLIQSSFQQLQNVEVIDFTKFDQSCEQQKISSNILTQLGQFRCLNRVVVFENQVNYLADLVKISCSQEFVVEVRGLQESRFQVICLFLDVLNKKKGDVSQNLKYFQLEINLTLEKIISLLAKGKNLPVKFSFTINQMVINQDKLDDFYDSWGNEDQIVGLNCCFCPDISPVELVFAATECPSLQKLSVTLTADWYKLRNDQVECFNQLQEFNVNSPCLGYESGACFLLENGLTQLSTINLWHKNTSMEQFLSDIKTIAQKAPNVSSVLLGNLFGSQWMDSVSQFQNLRELSIQGFNFKTMRHPDDLLKVGQLRRLRSLKLYGCGGELPYTFSSMFKTLTLLEELEICLFKNRFTMFEALCPLVKLQRLVVECVEPTDLQDNCLFLLELQQLRYVDFKLMSPFLLNTNQEEVQKGCVEVQKFIKEVCQNVRRVVIRGPRHKSIVYL